MAHRQSYAAKALLNEKKASAGFVSDRFPEISAINLHMTYYRSLSTNPVLMVRTINFFPTSYAYFDFDCMTENCSEGGFDLTSIISDLVRKHKKTAQGTLECTGSAVPPGHASISYEIKLDYK